MPDALLTVWFTDGGYARCEPDGFDALEEAMAQVMGEGAHQFTASDRLDTVVRLRKFGGGVIHARASAITAWSLTTHAERLAGYAADLALDRARETWCVQQGRAPSGAPREVPESNEAAE